MASLLSVTASAATWYDGTLIVTAKDVLGNPITNATVVVSAEDEDSAWSNATKYEEFEVEGAR